MIIKRFGLFEEVKKEIENISFESRYPFSEICYFETFCKHFSQVSNIYILGIYDENELVACGFFEKMNDEKVVFLGMKPVLGGQEVTDFGEIVWFQVPSSKLQERRIKEVWQSIFEHYKNEGVKILQLDYVREDSESYRFFIDRENCEIEKSHFIKISRDRQETSPYIDLMNIDNWESYLESLERVKRKELKRKIKRLEEKKYEYEIIEKIEEKDFEDFVRLHKLSDSQKDKFMSEKMKAFFADIIFCKRSSWEIKMAFLKIDENRVASLLFFENSKKILLYNSGFDPNYAYYSVGFLLGAYVLEKGIEDKKKIYDFLRGNERYKYDLGAKDLWLYKITVNLNYV